MDNEDLEMECEMEGWCFPDDDDKQFSGLLEEDE